MSKSAFSLDGKVIVITGAAGGIGMEVCRQLGGDGAKLIMADIDEVGLAAGKAELAARGVSAVTFKANSIVVENLVAILATLGFSIGIGGTKLTTHCIDSFQCQLSQSPNQVGHCKPLVEYYSPEDLNSPNHNSSMP